MRCGSMAGWPAKYLRAPKASGGVSRTEGGLGGALTWPLPARAQQPLKPVVGYLLTELTGAIAIPARAAYDLC